MLATHGDPTPLSPPHPVWHEPPALSPGAHVALLAPSGPLNGPHELERAVETAASLGWTVSVGRHALARVGYLAGDDVQRADDLRWALQDDAIDGIWCLRGGYGAARLLPHIWDTLQTARPKALLGYSDITALHAAWQRVGLVSYHGPVGRAMLSPFSRAHLLPIVQSPEPATLIASEAQVVRAGVATGHLAGGNLALVASLCGTPWACDFRGAIVVLEDVNEAPYRIDRMLTQLLMAGALDGCEGLAIGQFTDSPEDAEESARAVHAIVAELADALQVPALLGVPVGHIADQWTLPFGARATLDVDARRLSVRVPVSHSSLGLP